MPEQFLGLYVLLEGKHPIPSPPAVKASFSLHHQKGNVLERKRWITSSWIRGSLGWQDAFSGLKITSPASFDKVVHGGHLVLKLRLSDVK